MYTYPANEYCAEKVSRTLDSDHNKWIGFDMRTIHISFDRGYSERGEMGKKYGVQLLQGDAVNNQLADGAHPD